jgi:hypothetical protein
MDGSLLKENILARGGSDSRNFAKIQTRLFRKKNPGSEAGTYI